MVALPLGLGLVAAATRRAGHDIRFVDLVADEDAQGTVRRSIADFQPDVIGISVRNIDNQDRAAPRFLLDQARSIVRACRDCTTAPVVLGGAGFSIFPAETLAFLGADYGIAGDGEEALPALLEQLARGSDPTGIPGLCISGRDTTCRAVAADLDSFDLWDDTLSGCADPDDPTLWIPVQSRRGCPNDCSYCSTFRIQGRTIRTRAPALVVEHIRRLAGMGYRRFYFVDNSFNIPESHALALCRLLKELCRGIVWRCILYPHLVREELVAAMANAGCIEVAVGFESGCPRILKEMNKRYTPDDVRRTCELLRAHGIRRMGFLLLGGPGETRESVEESLAFAESLGLDGLRVTAGIRIYPGTALARRALAEGMIDSEDDLLRPHFYIAPGLEQWLHERVKDLLPQP